MTALDRRQPKSPFPVEVDASKHRQSNYLTGYGPDEVTGFTYVTANPGAQTYNPYDGYYHDAYHHLYLSPSIYATFHTNLAGEPDRRGGGAANARPRGPASETALRRREPRERLRPRRPTSVHGQVDQSRRRSRTFPGAGVIPGETTLPDEGSRSLGVALPLRQQGALREPITNGREPGLHGRAQCRA